MSERREHIDWEQAKQRLAAMREALCESAGLSPEQAQEVLRRRAEALAQTTPSAPDAHEILEAVTFVMAGEPFALETRFVREVTTPGNITPVPGAPPFLAGVTNLRGEVIAVMDLAVLLGTPRPSDSPAPQMLVLGERRVEFAVLAEQVDQVVLLRIDEILPPPGSLSNVAREFLRGVTADARLVLDGDVLLTDERLYVDEME